MPNFSEGDENCVLCGERVDGFRAEHRGEKPPSAGVGPCKYVASKVARAHHEGMIAALNAGIARAQQGWLRNPFPSMKPTEVKQTRDDMQSGAIKVFNAIRDAIKADNDTRSAGQDGSR
jgi:hypothetical protein